MLLINWVYYRRFKSKTHKHYNYLQRKIKWNVYTKAIIMSSWKAWVEWSNGIIKIGGGASDFYWSYLVKADNVETIERWHHAWNVFISVEKEKMFEWINSVVGLQHVMFWWYNDVGYKSPTGTMYRGQLYDVTHWIKFLYKYSKTMFLVLRQVYYWRFKSSNTHNNYN